MKKNVSYSEKDNLEFQTKKGKFIEMEWNSFLYYNKNGR